MLFEIARDNSSLQEFANTFVKSKKHFRQKQFINLIALYFPPRRHNCERMCSLVTERCQVKWKVVAKFPPGSHILSQIVMSKRKPKS